MAIRYHGVDVPRQAVLRDVMISVSGALDVEKPRQEYEDYAEVWIALVTDKRYASASNAIFGMFIASVQQVTSIPVPEIMNCN